MKKCLIITGGDPSPVFSKDQYDLVIACDRGYEHAKAMGIVPDLFIGDFDSVEEHSVLDAGIPVLRFPVQKDDSDTMLAIKHAIENGCGHICIVCALGGRFDHTFANIQGMAYAAKRGVSCEIEDEDEHLMTFTGQQMELPKRDGFAFSLFSLTDTCEHLSISGAAYPAEDITLKNTFPLGLSNGWAKEKVVITLEKGILLIVQSRLRG